MEANKCIVPVILFDSQFVDLLHRIIFVHKYVLMERDNNRLVPNSLLSFIYKIKVKKWIYLN